MVVFRSIKLVITEPKVSNPNVKGVTSNNTISSTSPANTPACTAAPKATASSGFTVLLGSLPNISSTLSCTEGIRVMPPTNITSSISFFDNPESFNAFSQGFCVREIKLETS